MSYTLKFLNHLGPDGFHRVAYREWGSANNDNVLICVHGISRRGADFDFIAEALSSTYRVLCPDMPGRGDSDWMDDKSTYAMPLYQSVCAALLARANADEVHWIGTSMGGRIGMRLAAMPNTPIRKLVLNDMGPHISPAGRANNFEHFGTDPRFATETEGKQYIRETRAAFGPTTEQAWGKFCRLPEATSRRSVDTTLRPGPQSDRPGRSVERHLGRVGGNQMPYIPALGRLSQNSSLRRR